MRKILVFVYLYLHTYVMYIYIYMYSIYDDHRAATICIHGKAHKKTCHAFQIKAYKRMKTKSKKRMHVFCQHIARDFVLFRLRV